MYIMSEEVRERIAENIVAFMTNDTPLLKESVMFLYNCLAGLNDMKKPRNYYEVWDIVLRKYLPAERPVLFRSSKRSPKRDIQTFTSSMPFAAVLSEEYNGQRTGYFYILDTKEYFRYLDENASEHVYSFFPLWECIKKTESCDPPCFSKPFYERNLIEQKYIVRVNNDVIYRLKWAKEKESNE